MAEIDNRSLDHKVLEHMRHLAVDRVLAGERPSEVAKSLGIYRTSIYKWLRAHKKGGREALKSTVAKGPQPKLSDQQKNRVRQWVIGKDPRQYGFDFGLWTRSIIAEMIEDRFGVSLTLPSVGHLLASLDITPQKPLRRAYERDEPAIQQWKEQQYPVLRKRARQRGANIFFLDEVGVRSDSPLGRSYGLRGKTPVVKTSGQRQKMNAVSAVNARGAFWYKVYGGTLTATLFVALLKDLMKGRKKPVMLVLDGLPAHKAKMVAQYVQSTQGRLELHFLPPYAPDLNPDEFVWSHLKKNGISKKPLHKNEALRTRMETDLAAIKQDSGLVRSFFMAPSVSYAIYC
jgi:transposase